MAEIDEYKALVTWRLRLAVEHDVIVYSRSLPFYFGEAVAVLKKLKAYGLSVKKCIKVLGGMMGSVDFFRDFILEHDTQGTCAEARSRAVVNKDVAFAKEQLRYYIGASDSPYIKRMAEAVEEACWDDALFQLLAKLQVKTYRICSEIDDIMGMKKDSMN